MGNRSLAPILFAAALLLCGCPLGEEDYCSRGHQRCEDGLLYECLEDYGDNPKWIFQGTCPMPHGRVADPLCARRKAYCEDAHTIVHCDAGYFSHRVDCAADPSYPDADLCVEPEPDVALCSPTEFPELACEDVNRINGWGCAGDQLLSCQYGYVREYIDCEHGCTTEWGDASCKAM